MENPLISKMIQAYKQLHHALKTINIISHHDGTGMYQKNRDIKLVLEKLRDNLIEEESNYNDLFLFQERLDSAHIKTSEFKCVMGMGFYIFHN